MSAKKISTKKTATKIALKAPTPRKKGGTKAAEKKSVTVPVVTRKPSKALDNAKARQAKSRKSPANQAFLAKLAPKFFAAKPHNAEPKPVEERVNTKLKALGAALTGEKLSFAERMKAARAAKKPYVAPDDVALPKAEAAALQADRKVEDKPKPAPVAMPTIQQDDFPPHTMAKSYVRSTGAGKGKQRGSTYQCTVSFTKTQIDQVVAGALFRNVSLAEMIRSCVVEHLGKTIIPCS